jgi:DNA-binding CsgD family transcriptional regulator
VINLVFIILFFGLYFDENLSEDFYSGLVSQYRAIIDLILSLIVLGLIYFMSEILLAFRNIRIGAIPRKTVIAFIIILTFSYLTRIIFPVTESYFFWLDFLRNRVFENLIVFEFLILLVSLFFWGKTFGKDSIKLFRIFSSLYLFRYVLSFLVAYLFTQYNVAEPWRFMIGLSILIIYNLFPLLWIRFFFLEYANNILLQNKSNINLKRIYDKYSISNREIEIINLILSGKSNKEIEETLFISFHTVKNHISNIFRKLRVKSRYELINFLMRYEE